MIGTVLTVSSRAVLEACRRLGLDTDAILRAAELDRATLDDPDRRIPLSRMAALWRKAYELSNDPDLALHAIEILPPGSYRVVEFLAANAPTVGEALAKVSDYFPLINSVVRLPISVGESEVTMGVESPTAPSLLTRPYAEYTMAAIYLRTRDITGTPWALERVEFSHAEPPSRREHERIFGCPVRFGSDGCRLVLSRVVWETRCAGENRALYDILDRHARLLLERLPNDSTFASRVRGAVRAELRGGDPRLSAVSRKLGLSPRTLQRRLDDEGVAFNDLVDDERHAAAASYLAELDIAASEVAYLLGFSSQSSFHRAFRRWSGRTPAEFRRAARKG